MLVEFCSFAMGLRDCNFFSLFFVVFFLTHNKKQFWWCKVSVLLFPLQDDDCALFAWFQIVFIIESNTHFMQVWWSKCLKQVLDEASAWSWFRTGNRTFFFIECRVKYLEIRYKTRNRSLLGKHDHPMVLEQLCTWKRFQMWLTFISYLFLASWCSSNLGNWWFFSSHYAVLMLGILIDSLCFSYHEASLMTGMFCCAPGPALLCCWCV